MDLDTLESIVIIAYTLWKWKTEKADRDEKKEKERIKGSQAKRTPKKRSKK